MTPNVTTAKHAVSATKRSNDLVERPPRCADRKGRRLTRWLQVAAVVLMITSGLAIWIQMRNGRRTTAPTEGHRLTRTYPHSPDAYCQGLVYHDGFLYEGTGSYGKSVLRKVELETGKVLQEHKLPNHFFGEGITIWEDKIIQLTWKNQVAVVYDLKTFQPVGHFKYRGEGWGLTHDGRHLIMSDGTSTLRFLDPETFRVKRQLTVRDGRSRVGNLNELEYVQDEIYANIWYEDRIARISPGTGNVIGWLDLSRLYPESERAHEDAVLNGIAYDPQRQRLLVTGKNWPKLYEIQLPR